MATARSSARRRNDGAIPLAYLGAVVLAALIILPTALRPPPDPAQQSAEFSPDAPPDDQQDAIVSSLNRGSSQTAGAAPGEGPGDPAGPPLDPNTPTTPPPPPPPARSCKNGRGNPPRQVESLYAAPCAPAFVGDNGGDTYQGVTRNEIRIAINGTNAGGSDPCADGKLPPEPPATGECDADRTYRVLMQYFNENFQFYGRRIQFYVAQPNTTTETDVRAAAIQGADEYKVFAAAGLYSPGCQEYARRKLLAFCAQLPLSQYKKWSPYLWSFYQDGTELADFSAEYICKRLVGKTAGHVGDPTMQNTKRKFGLVYFSSRDYAENGPYLEQKLKACGTDVLAIAANPDDQNGQAGLATVVSRFKIEGVTSVIPNMDAVSQVAMTNIATSNGYFPEWITTGAGANTANAIGQLMDQRQWAHAFGIQPYEAERANDLHDCYRAYRTIDPAGTPNYTGCKAFFYSYLQLMNGIQAAGPNLNPTTFAQGLYKIGMRWPTKPSWAVGGGFAPGVQTYIHNYTTIWWSSTTQDPQYLNAPGAYFYEDAGKRYRLGELTPTEKAFDPNGAVVTPKDAAEYDGP
jgi:hypothetical protein